MKPSLFQSMMILCFAPGLLLAQPRSVQAQGAIASGETRTGTIAPVGDSDSWTFVANADDAIVVRLGEISQSGNFLPRLRLFGPGANLLDTSWSASAAEVALAAPTGGTYTAVVDDLSGVNATGTYRISLARTGSPVTVSPGDEGGPLTNGAVHTGTIELGDIDLWTLDATAGEAIIVRMGETSAGSTLTPWLRLYGPDGTLLDHSYAAAAAEIAVTALTTGAYLVVVGDNTSGWVGTGPYRLTLAKTGSPVTVSPGDEGGPLAYALGTLALEVGDLDVWTVTAHAGETIVVHMNEVVAGSTLTPWLRLYGPTGTLLRTNYGAGVADVSVTAGSSGAYLVVAADNASGWSGSGTYQLNPSGTSGAPEMLPPAALRLSPGFPNPFVAHTTLRYEIPAAGTVALRIFDAQGRMVRTLVEEASVSAGPGEATWDGTDVTGQAAAPGVYFARLESGGRPLVRKLILSR